MKCFSLLVVAFLVLLVFACGGGLGSLSSEQKKEMKDGINTLQKTVVAIETGSIRDQDLLNAETDVKLSMERAKLPEGQLKSDINATFGVFHEVSEVISEMKRSVARGTSFTAEGIELAQKFFKKYPSSFKTKVDHSPDLPDAMDALAVEARKAFEKVASEGK